MYNPKMKRNVFALVQIFKAIPPLSFSAPAELCVINPTTDPYVILIHISYLLIYRAQYILGVRQSRIPSKNGFGRLNLQCRSDISLHIYLYLISCHLGTKPNYYYYGK